MRNCNFCGESDLALGLGIAMTLETGTIGLEYQNEKRGMFSMANPVEPLRVDLCKKCGTVQRFFVPNAERPWASLENSSNIQ